MRHSPLYELTFSVYLPSFLVGVGQQAMLLMLPLYALEIGGGAGAAAVLLGMKGIGTMLSDVPSGIAVSRFGDKNTMLGSLVICIVACVGFAFVDNTWALACLSLVFGVGVGGWMLARLHYITERCPVAYRGRAMTVMAGIHRAGNFVGPALAGIAATQLGYPSVFIGAAVLMVVGLGLVMALTKGAAFRRPAESVEEQDESGGAVRPLRQRPKSPVGAIGRILREHRGILATAGAATILLQFIRAGRALLVPLWGEHIGLNAAEIGFAISLSSVIDMSFFYVAGYVMDHWGRKWSSVPTMLFLALSLALLPFAHSQWAFVVVVLISGLGNGFGTGIVMTLGADFSPSENRGEFLGVWRFLGDTGSAVGPFVMGVVAQTFMLSGALWLTAGVGFAGAVMFAFLVPETLRRGRQ
ncbi:MAG: MFS transporter [Gammaproteobacteria bacterium]|nr:MFS transporter [Gammaproteobacteria bacterium]